ncbi:MAG TPA: uracil-DNA glycosylase [Candidatus Sulfotelmatobacter sp.]|nr:uracil-DNA glycosylase [Candidatus Sulfotelmatobacter sp.]
MREANRQTKSKDPVPPCSSTSDARSFPSCDRTMPSHPLMTTLSSRLEKNWRDIISGEFKTGVEFEQHMAKLEQFLQREKGRGRDIYPKDEEIFNALNLTAFKKIKVVIIGQDPYHKKGQAHGLCFSVPKDIEQIPPSLRNIYEELKNEYGIRPSDGDLTGWAEQGVLLLNATLTVQKGRAGSHQGKGWEEFTDAIIRAVSEKREPVVFLLWGRCAQKKGELIDRKKHKVLETSHPSGLSAYRGFLKCGHFKEANVFLIKHGLKPVVWQKI